MSSIAILANKWKDLPSWILFTKEGCLYFLPLICWSSRGQLQSRILRRGDLTKTCSKNDEFHNLVWNNFPHQSASGFACERGICFHLVPIGRFDKHTLSIPFFCTCFSFNGWKCPRNLCRRIEENNARTDELHEKRATRHLKRLGCKETPAFDQDGGPSDFLGGGFKYLFLSPQFGQ